MSGTNRGWNVGLGVGRAFIIAGLVGFICVPLWWWSLPQGSAWEDNLGEHVIGAFLLLLCGILTLIGWGLALKNKKGRLPIMTRIAIWLMVATGVIGVIIGIATSEASVLSIMFLPAFILFMWPVVFLSLKEGWAWAIAIIIFILELVFIFPWEEFNSPFIVFPILIMPVPFILILLDVRNYWEMTRNIAGFSTKRRLHRQRRLVKNESHLTPPPE